MDADQLRTLFARWEKSRGIVLAVSGGPDSMAMLLLAVRWAAILNNPPQLHALTFDHALRPESADEAQLVAAACAKLGVPHKTLRWTGEKPATGIQEAARNERYRQLFVYARQVGADTVFTGHHADDQAETILFRLSRGSGLTGLAGIRPNALPEAGLTLGRPLLSLRKQQLVDLCAEAGQPCVADPSNQDPRYARTTMRKALQALTASGVASPDWPRLAARLARADEALDEISRQALSDCRQTPAGQALCALEFNRLAQSPQEVVLRAVQRAIEDAIRSSSPLSGQGPLRLERLESLVARLLEAHRRRERLTSTLAGLKITLAHRGVLEIFLAAPRRRS